jgi:hypothetical protein
MLENHATKDVGGLEIKLYKLLNLALGGDKWSNCTLNHHCPLEKSLFWCLLGRRLDMPQSEM